MPVRDGQDSNGSLNDPEIRREIIAAIMAKHPGLFSAYSLREKDNILTRITVFLRKIFARRTAEESFLDLYRNASSKKHGEKNILKRIINYWREKEREMEYEREARRAMEIERIISGAPSSRSASSPLTDRKR